MKFGADIHVSLRMINNTFGDSLTLIFAKEEDCGSESWRSGGEDYMYERSEPTRPLNCWHQVALQCGLKGQAQRLFHAVQVVKPFNANLDSGLYK